MNRKKRLIIVVIQYSISLCTFHLRRLWVQRLTWHAPNRFLLSGTELTFSSFPSSYVETYNSSSPWSVSANDVYYPPCAVFLAPSLHSLIQMCIVTSWSMKMVEPQNESVLMLLRGKRPAALIHPFCTFHDKQPSIKFWPLIHFGGIHITVVKIAPEVPCLNSSFNLNRDICVFHSLK